MFVTVCNIFSNTNFLMFFIYIFVKQVLQFTYKPTATIMLFKLVHDVLVYIYTQKRKKKSIN